MLMNLLLRVRKQRAPPRHGGDLLGAEMLHQGEIPEADSAVAMGGDEELPAGEDRSDLSR